MPFYIITRPLARLTIADASTFIIASFHHFMTVLGFCFSSVRRDSHPPFLFDEDTGGSVQLVTYRTP